MTAAELKYMLGVCANYKVRHHNTIPIPVDDLEHLINYTLMLQDTLVQCFTTRTKHIITQQGENLVQFSPN